jgi:hypothetical protein
MWHLKKKKLNKNILKKNIGFFVFVCIHVPFWKIICKKNKKTLLTVEDFFFPLKRDFYIQLFTFKFVLFNLIYFETFFFIYKEDFETRLI